MRPDPARPPAQSEEAGSTLKATSNVASAEQALLACEQAELLHDEIERLPRAFRLPIVLCYLEGNTVHEAARRLGCSHGTVRSRMARARDKLRRGLSRRGMVLPATAIAAALSSRPASASIPSHLCETTARAAIQFVTGRTVAPFVAAVAREVLRSMLATRLKLAALSLLLLAAGVTGAAYLAQARGPQPERQTRSTAQPKHRVPPPGRMFVVGRVLDPAGKEIAGVPIEIVGRPREPWLPATANGERRLLLGSGVSTAGGRFSLEASRTSAVRFFHVYALAAAPGFGLSWAELNPNAAEPTVEIRLEREQIIHGKVLDMNGQPVPMVGLQIGSVGRPTKIGTFDGVNFGNAVRPSGLGTWPRPVTTDDQGRFSLSGIGRDLAVVLNIRDGRFAGQSFRIQTDDRDGPKDFTQTLQPAIVVEGQVLAEDTGLPLARAAVTVSGNTVLADEQGHYTANVLPAARYQIEVFPVEGRPYLAVTHDFDGAKGAVKTTKDIKLPRGVLIQGKVIEHGSGRSLAGASVQWIARAERHDLIDGWQAVVATRKMAPIRSSSHLEKGACLFTVRLPTTSSKRSAAGCSSKASRAGNATTPTTSFPTMPSPVTRCSEVNSELELGRDREGPSDRSGGTDRRQTAEIVALLHFNYFHLNWRGDLTIHARDGAFELHGLDPEKATRVSFLDADHQWGTTVELSGNQSGNDVTVRLLAMRPGDGAVRSVRMASRSPEISRTSKSWAAPAHQQGPGAPKHQDKLAADAAYVVNLDRKHYWNGSLDRPRMAGSRFPA